MQKFHSLFVIFMILAFSVGCSSTPEVVEEPQAQEEAPPSEPEPTAAVEPEPVQPEPEPEVVLETTFYFDYDDSSIQPSAIPVIKAHAERIKTNSETIRIEGHADERGTETYNRELGKRRADAVRDLLISMGVSSSQIKTVSYGEESPQTLGSGESVWQKNRRVELK